MFQLDEVCSNISNLGLPFNISGNIDKIYYISLNDNNNLQFKDPLFDLFGGTIYTMFESPKFYLDEIQKDFEVADINYQIQNKDKITLIDAEVGTKEQLTAITKYIQLLGQMNYTVIWSNNNKFIDIETSIKPFFFSLLHKKSIELIVNAKNNSTFVWFDHDFLGIYLFSNEKRLSNLKMAQNFFDLV